MIGAKGLTPAIIQEAIVAIKVHELIKVKIAGMLKEEREEAAEELNKALGAELLQIIGSIAILYKKNEEKK